MSNEPLLVSLSANPLFSAIAQNCYIHSHLAMGFRNFGGTGGVGGSSRDTATSGDIVG